MNPMLIIRLPRQPGFSSFTIYNKQCIYNIVNFIDYFIVEAPSKKTKYREDAQNERDSEIFLSTCFN